MIMQPECRGGRGPVWSGIGLIGDYRQQPLGFFKPYFLPGNALFQQGNGLAQIKQLLVLFLQALLVDGLAFNFPVFY